MATVTGTKRLLDISGDNITTAVSLEAEGTLLDSNGQPGTTGQLLSSTATGVDWIAGGADGTDGADGIDGTNVITISPLGRIIQDNPWKALHVIINGHPDEAMPALRPLGVETLANILAYVQTLPRKR